LTEGRCRPVEFSRSTVGRLFLLTVGDVNWDASTGFIVVIEVSAAGRATVLAMSLRSLARSRRCALKFPTIGAKPLARLFSRTVSVRSKSEEQIAAVEMKGAEALSPRWLSDLKSRIGKCIIFGLRPEQLQRAGNILDVVAREWRDLVAGSEGFLTGPKRAGLERHRVVWGDMDSMVIMIFPAPLLLDRSIVGIPRMYY